MRMPLRQLLALVLALTTILLHGNVVAYASNSSIGSIDELHGTGGNNNGMSGGALFMSDAYRDNYYLDIEELGIMDAIPAAGSALANTIFFLDRMLVDLTTTIFFTCTTIKIADIMANVWDEVQTSLKTNIFDVLLPFAVVATLSYIAVLVLKQNGQAVVGQLTQFFVIILSVTLLTTNTASVVTFIDDLTQGISTELVAAIYGVEGDDSDPRSYAATVAGGMWETMIHTPWVALNLEGKEALAEPLLENTQSSEARNAIIGTQLKKDDNTLFLKSKPWKQFGILILYTVPLLARCAIYLCLGGMMLAFRLFTVILALFGIIILFLALFPQLGGIAIVYRWLQKLLNIQINILTLSLMLAFIMRIDKTLYIHLSSTGKGWLLIVFIQSLICALIFLMRKQLLGISKTIGQSVNGTQMAQRMLTRSDDAIYNAPQNIATAARTTKAVAGHVAGFVGRQWDAATYGMANTQTVVERRSREINAHRQERRAQRHTYTTGESVHVYDTPTRHSANTSTTAETSPAHQPAAALERPRLSLDSTEVPTAPTPATLPTRPKLQETLEQRDTPPQHLVHSTPSTPSTSSAPDTYQPATLPTRPMSQGETEDTPVRRSASVTARSAPTYQPTAVPERPQQLHGSAKVSAAPKPVTLPTRPKLQTAAEQTPPKPQPTHSTQATTRADAAQATPTLTQTPHVERIDHAEDVQPRPSLQTAQNSPTIDVASTSSVITATQPQRTTATARPPQGDAATTRRSYQRPTPTRARVAPTELRQRKKA